MTKDKDIVQIETIEHLILLIRGQRVVLDSSLASLYGVDTKALNRAIKRNISRFPPDFMFQVTEEAYAMRYQFGTSKGRGGRRYLPYVFNEHGVLMAATVLNSEKAVHMSILIVRAFVKFRGLLASHKDLSLRLDDLEKKYDKKFSIVFEAIKQLMEPPEELAKEPIGFNI